MSRINAQRKSCKDVFNAFLVSLATYAGIFEFPRIRPTYDVPDRVIVFSKALSCKDYGQWVHFYEDDHLFERVWRNPRKYLEVLRRFKGVIMPDFRNSGTIHSDIVHEGTHAIDYLNGLPHEKISSWDGEIRAYTAEHHFQNASGLAVQFTNEDEIRVHVWSNYKKKGRKR